MKLYEMDGAGVATGASREFDYRSAAPAGWVPNEPPELSTGEIAVWNGSGWSITQAPQVNPNPPPVVPQSVSRFQALAALSNAGLLTQAQNAVNASTNPLVPLAWNNAQTFDRNSATVATLGPALGLTDAQIDSLFIAASIITA